MDRIKKWGAESAGSTISIVKGRGRYGGNIFEDIRPLA